MSNIARFVKWATDFSIFPIIEYFNCISSIKFYSQES